MLTHDATICCPDCGAPLSRFVEACDSSGDGVLVCEHAHVYDLDDPDDDRRLRDAHGPDYRLRILALVPQGWPDAAAVEVADHR